jgi:hypothetical protein
LPSDFSVRNRLEAHGFKLSGCKKKARGLRARGAGGLRACRVRPGDSILSDRYRRLTSLLLNLFGSPKASDYHAGNSAFEVYGPVRGLYRGAVETAAQIEVY